MLEADWEEHWDVLNITLEVMHFARDAQLAEEWIVKEDLNLYGKDKGVSLRFSFSSEYHHGDTKYVKSASFLG